MTVRSTLILLSALGACAISNEQPGVLGALERALAKADRPELVSDRRLADLDASADSRIDSDDAGRFARFADRCRAEVDRRGLVINPLQRLYHGPTTALAQLVKDRRELGIELGSVNDNDLVALAIESRWLAAQARLATGRSASSGSFGGILSDRVPGYSAQSMEPAQVCASIQGLDLSSYTSAGVVVPAAVFDLDSTVWPGNVMDPFLAVLIEDRLIRPEVNAELVKFLKTVPGIDDAQVARNDVIANARLLLTKSTDPKLPAEQKISTKDAFYNIVALLKGLRVEETEAAARKVFDKGSANYPPWQQHMFADRDGCNMPRIMALLAERGVRVYLLSAGLDLLSWEAARSLGLPKAQALGSLLEVKDGVHTGVVLDNTYTSKGAVVRQWLSAPPILVFGDSPQSDFAMMLEAAGAAFMINPRPQFVERDDKEAGGRFVAVVFDGTEDELRAP